MNEEKEILEIVSKIIDENLNLEKMTNDDIKITGKIESIELERVQD